MKGRSFSVMRITNPIRPLTSTAQRERGCYFYCVTASCTASRIGTQCVMLVATTSQELRQAGPA